MPASGRDNSQYNSRGNWIGRREFTQKTTGPRKVAVNQFTFYLRQTKRWLNHLRKSWPRWIKQIVFYGLLTKIKPGSVVKKILTSQENIKTLIVKESIRIWENVVSRKKILETEKCSERRLYRWDTKENQKRIFGRRTSYRGRRNTDGRETMFRDKEVV